MSSRRGEGSAAVEVQPEPHRAGVTTGGLPRPLPRDRENPTIAEVLLHDPTQPLSAEVRILLARDLARRSHRGMLPFARAFSLFSVAMIRALKRVLPFQFSSHRAIDGLCLWFMRRFMSADAAELLVRHFVVETNLLAFIAENCGAEIPAPQLRPTTLAEIGRENAVIAHDLAVYNLVIDVGQSAAELVKRDALDYSMIYVPVLDGERTRKRWLDLDIETALYWMNIPFCFFTTAAEYERAVNSFQLDESVCAMLADLTGDPVFRTWTPVKFPAWISVGRDVPRELFFHACVCEYAHTHLERLRDNRSR